MTKTLSICIPTYNRANYLDELISNIFKQFDEFIFNKVVICVSDNASTDNTKEILIKWKIFLGDNFIFHINNVNQGPDFNYQKVIEISNTKYCWFVGSDDLIRNDSLKLVLQYIQSDSDVYIFPRTNCTLEMKEIETFFWFNKNFEYKKYNLKNENELICYLKNCNTLGALFSFLSSIIVKKETWDKVNIDTSYLNSAYSHVYKILSFLNTTTFYVEAKKKSIINCRLGNDYFSSEGFYKRVLIDFEGYSKLADDIFYYDNAIKKIFLSILSKEHKLIRIVKLRIVSTQEQWDYIYPLLKSSSCNTLFLKFLNVLPNKIIKCIKHLIIN